MMRTPDQTAAIETMAKTLCVDAGAGSGKTSVLIERMIQVIAKGGATLDQIVAITFTDKAAAEMKVRLRAAFRDKAPRDDPEEMSRWRDMERRVETARISTIHSFCASLLRENALRIGRDPDFAVLAESEASLMRNEVVTDAVHRLLEQGEASAVRVAVEYGAQKTIGIMETMLARRALIDRIVADHPVRDAAALAAHWQSVVVQEANRRLRELVENGELLRFRDALASFEGRCAKSDDGREQLRVEMLELADRALRSKNLVEAAASIAQLAEASLGKRRGFKKNWDSEDAMDDLKNVQEGLKRRARECIPEPVCEETEARAAQIAVDLFATFERVAASFEEAKAARTSLDFDDLIRETLAVLRENEEVRGRVARSMKHLLIDEFQDTDATQLEIARLLAEVNGGPDLFMVGDAKQSIYDFRGAEVEVFQQEKGVANRVIPLHVNFRSAPDVLAFVNELFARTGLLAAVEQDYTPLEVHRPLESESRIEFLIPGETDGARADYYRRVEAELIAGRIAAMCAEDSPARVSNKDGTRRLIGFGDIAMLFRSTSSVYLYEAELRKREIPYNVVAGSGFYERQEILDLRNLLTLPVDPWDEMALLGFLRGPLGAMSDEALMGLCDGGRLVQSFHSEDLPEDAALADRLRAARTMIADLRARTEMPLAAFLRYVLDRTGYEAIALSQFLGAQKAYNVRKLVDLAEDFARTRPAKLAAFVHYLDAVSAQSEVREGDAVLQAEDTGAVTLMTIHKSKGLEFPVVIVPDLSRDRKGPDARDLVLHRTLGLAVRVMGGDGETVKPGIYNAIQNAHKEKDAAEHARVLYVAMTRARDWLLLGGGPKGGDGSWFKTFDDCYNVTGRSDGETIAGTGWSAVIRRKVSQTAVARIAEVAAAPLDREALVAHADPLSHIESQRITLSVSEVLDRMAPSGDEASNETGAPRGVIDPRLRGTVIHRMLETWDLRGEPPVAACLARECPARKTSAMLEPALHEAARRFRESVAGQRMAADSDLQREVPFALRVAETLVAGVIDALLSDGSIVDYKTGRPHAALQERYENQLRLYAAAVRALRGQSPPVAYLYYVDSGETHEIDISSTRLDEVLRLVEDTLAAPQLGSS